MYKALFMFLISCAVFTPSGAIANFETGDKLYQGCSSNVYDPASIFTLAYVLGVIDDTQDTQLSKRVPVLVCLPQDVTAGQLKEVVCKGLANNPQVRQRSAAYLTFDYIKAAFPCH